MQKHSFENWLLVATCVLAGLILLPSNAHAANLQTADFIANNPMKFGLAMLACYLGIKIAPSNRQHF